MRPICLFFLTLFSTPAWAQLSYSTYLRAGFTPTAIAADSTGNVYLAGYTQSAALGGQVSIMAMKLNPAATQVVYARIIGGTATDSASAIAVDSSGNVYLTGAAYSPDFPVTPGRQLGAAPGGPSAGRTFVVKLDAQGDTVFSDLVGGTSTSFGRAIAVTSQGYVLVSGMADPAFPVSSGAYTVTSTAAFRPYLMELDAAGASVRFAAYGIGGDALAIDASGHLYMAGATVLTDYPTTPGAYQTALNPVYICGGFCRISFPGTNQYLTKTDANATRVLYSTGVAGGGQTTNTGLAIDSSGNVYLTGLAYGAYPYTVADPGVPQVRPFLTKIDAAGQHALYSVPIGGEGVALDGSGHVLVGGTYNNLNLILYLTPSTPAPPPAAVNAVSPCLLTGGSGVVSQAYASQVDSSTGAVQQTIMIDGTNVTAASVALSPTGLWIIGTTAKSDVPVTPGAISSAAYGTGAGAYLGQVNFTKPVAGAPVVGCLLDSASGNRPTAMAQYQTLSLFGANLGPAAGVAASDAHTTQLGGVRVLFDGVPVPLLYASASQINFLAPANPNNSASASFQVSISGTLTDLRQLAFTAQNPNLFLNPTAAAVCAAENRAITSNVFALALNSDGNVNSCDHGAAAGSVVSVFVDGLGGFAAGGVFAPAYPPGIYAEVIVDHLSAEIVGISNVNDYVWKIDVRIPTYVVGSVATFANIGVRISTGTATLAAAPDIVGGYPVATIWVTP